MRSTIIKGAVVALALGLATACAPTITNRDANRATPADYSGRSSTDTTNVASQSWQTFFSDPTLNSLIGQALENNQDLNVTRLEIEIARQEVRARKGAYLPSVGYEALAGVDRQPRYTVLGATEEANAIAPGRTTPEFVPNYLVGITANWEVDIWRKLRNARKAAALRYLASVEGKNFVVTNLVSDIAGAYYELLALDAQLRLVRRTIVLQTNAFASVRAQKEAARVTELAVRRFQAQVLHTRSLQFDIQQRIVEAENRINFLAGRFPQPIPRDTTLFAKSITDSVAAGIPAQLLLNRPDIRQAEANLAAAKLDVQVARAYFKPSLMISALGGYQAFNPGYLLNTPESMILSLLGGLTGPLVNRNGLYAAFYTADARQRQSIYQYERSVINGYTEVYNQITNIRNLQQSYTLRRSQVDALNESSVIANQLFNSARADYVEVLLTQRDALDASFDLVDTRRQQLNARVSIYRALGGGWR